MRVDIIILAAGCGSRMKSDLSKVLHCVAGKPMLEHVILSARELQKTVGGGRIHVVIGYKAEQIKNTLDQHDLNWVFQKEQLGTGHAVEQAMPDCEGAEVVIVLYGDVPLIRASTLKVLLEASNTERLGLLVFNHPNPEGYGRIIRNRFGNIEAIIEHKEATTAQKEINEVNTGIMAIPGSRFSHWIRGLKNENSKQEFYLTDVVAIAVAENTPVVAVQPESSIEVYGVNNRIQLSELERAYQKQLADALMIKGVTLVDPNRLDIRGELKTGQDITIDINVVFEGSVELGDHVYIQSGCIIRNSVIRDGAVIKAHSVLENAFVAESCEVGPFAHLRPGTELQEKVKVGNFVEIKKTVLGKNSKVNHLSYVGDSEVGKAVNIGAGTITCNYDGTNKYKTVIGDGAFIGSNNSLVAPVTIGCGATCGAGSTIVKDVPDEQLAVARGKQRNIEGWHRPVKAELIK